MTRRKKFGSTMLVLAAGALLALIPAVIIAQGNERSSVAIANGGAVESMRTITDDAREYIQAADGLRQVANMSVVVPDAVANSADLLVITYSATAIDFLAGTGDWMKLVVTVDGTAVPPTDTGYFQFCSSSTWNSLSHQFAVKVPAGSHTVKVYWQVFDEGAADPLIGLMESKTLSVQRHN